MLKPNKSKKKDFGIMLAIRFYDEVLSDRLIF